MMHTQFVPASNASGVLRNTIQVGLLGDFLLLLGMPILFCVLHTSCLLCFLHTFLCSFWLAFQLLFGLSLLSVTSILSVSRFSCGLLLFELFLFTPCLTFRLSFLLTSKL